MNYVAILLATDAPSEVVIDDTWYSPGVVGFIATFGVAAGAVFLIFDMVRRIRKVRYRAEITERLDQEENQASTDTREAKPTQKPNAKPARPIPPPKPKRD